MVGISHNGGGWSSNLTARVLKHGLDVLGIETVEQM
jgi:hypothetical protein